MSRLLIDEPPLQVVPTLAVKLGLNRAMFVQQLHYWLQKPGSHTRDGRRWVYNTYDGWHEQFPFWTPEAIRKIVVPLEKQGVLITTQEYNERKGDRTKWYTIDYEAINALLQPEEEDQPENCPDQPENCPHVQPDKITERYQRLPESSNRDPALHAGADAPKNTKKVSGHNGVGKLVDLLAEARARDKHPPPLIGKQKGEYGQFYKQAIADGEAVDTCDLALRWLVAKASGEIRREPKAWAYFGTALDAVRNGWRPERNGPKQLTAEEEAEIDALFEDYDYEEQMHA